MNKPQNQNLFSPYPSTEFNCWSSHPFTYLTPIKDPPFRAEFPRLDHNVGSTLPPGELSMTEMTDVPTLPHTSTVGLATLSCT